MDILVWTLEVLHIVKDWSSYSIDGTGCQNATFYAVLADTVGILQNQKKRKKKKEFVGVPSQTFIHGLLASID